MPVYTSSAIAVNGDLLTSSYSTNVPISILVKAKAYDLHHVHTHEAILILSTEQSAFVMFTDWFI